MIFFYYFFLTSSSLSRDPWKEKHGGGLEGKIDASEGIHKEKGDGGDRWEAGIHEREDDDGDQWGGEHLQERRPTPMRTFVRKKMTAETNERWASTRRQADIDEAVYEGKGMVETNEKRASAREKANAGEGGKRQRRRPRKVGIHEGEGRHR